MNVGHNLSALALCQHIDLPRGHFGQEHLADRAYSPRTVRAYGYDLLAFCRLLDVEETDLDDLSVETVLKFRTLYRGPRAGSHQHS
ncbi:MULTISPECIES: site-specific integrase [unclassified Rhodococcus (in: high G+C Gram-positive bacteria)]|uniref:site-specific integrase n=1 Tax=unclassified Rhodococcus (in: high G+C Gram-positive bacteria) TaxID=192944 RepID=UPI002F96E388